MIRSRVPWPAYFTVVSLLSAAVFISYIDRTNISIGAIAMQAEFGWSETEKGLVLSAFFVGYMVMMPASGLLAYRYGGKNVLGAAVLWWSLCTALTPIAACISLPALVGARIALGLGEAAVFPSAINMIGRWVPRFQQSRAVALTISSLHLGTVFALPASGWLIKAYGWPMPFYVFGAVGVIWAVPWYTRVGRGSASDVPVIEARTAVPWSRLLRMKAVWAIVVGHFCCTWSLYLMLAWLPSYLKRTFGIALVNAGFLSVAPWVVGFLMANAGGYLADRLLRAGHRPIVVRKLMQTAGLVLGGLFLLQVPDATTLTSGLLLMCGAAGAISLCGAGYAPNCFDIAPRHADVIWGISNTFASLPGIIGVFVTGWLVDRTGSFAAPFLLTAGVSFFGAAFFLVFASGNRQIE